MKIDIEESLVCSWLRHVHQCWLVQANWKFSEHWKRWCLCDGELEELFSNMKDRFDRDGKVFKRTSVKQLRKQGEMDAVGIDYEGGVHAAETAFHENGLHYRNPDKVLKKMLCTLLILRALRLPETRLHIYFLTPKARPNVQQSLEATFTALRTEYPKVEWRLITNDGFAKDVVRPTLEKASKVTDSSELFLRSAKLLELVEHHAERRPSAQRTRSGGEQYSAIRTKFQPLVQSLMKTLLVNAPTLLSEEHKAGLQCKEYCQKELGLKISYPLLVKVDGRQVNGRDRYYKEQFGAFYVCSEWKSHSHNAQRLLDFVESLCASNAGEQGVEALRCHKQAFSRYLSFS